MQDPSCNVTQSRLCVLKSVTPGDGNQSSNANSGQSATIKIGLIRPVTGTVAASGKDMDDCWNLYWAQHGTTVAGKKVVTLAQDDAGNPSVALNKAQQLVANDHVDMVVGPLLANVGYALADAMNRQQVPTVMPIVSADDITQRKRMPYVLRV